MKPALVRGGFKKQIANLKVGLTSAAIRRISTNSDDYQYIQKSTVPTLHFQPGLPQLPIPPLEKTLQRYLAAQRPLLTDKEFKSTETIVREFQKREGKALHEQLVAMDKRNEHTSYLAEAWLNIYLTSREPVPNVNGCMKFADDPKTKFNDQLTRASNIVISALRFLHSVRANFLEPEIRHTSPAKSDTPMFRQVMRLIPSRISCQFAKLFFKAVPLDMSQYEWQFNSVRVPCRGRDKLLLDKKATHVMALRNGNIYVFDVLDDKGYIKEPSYIHNCLKRVLSDCRPKAEFPVAAVTTLDRDTAAGARQQIIDAGNAEALCLVDTAIFSINLSDVVVGDNQVLLVQSMNPGDGTNSWSDKGLEFLITKDGKAALQSEHSMIDGVTNLRLINEVIRDSTTRPFIHPSSHTVNAEPTAVQCLEFKCSPGLRDEIRKALEKHNVAALQTQFNAFRYDKFGKNFIKGQKLSPDAIVQLAFQMGYYRLSGKTVATYESCSTAAFRHGRTETIRSATEATKRCSEAFAGNGKSAAELRSLIEASCRVHQALARDAAAGHGFDRHLFMLRVLADAEGGKKLPAFFADPAYKAINHNILSTSGLSSEALELVWFSPVVQDGLGIGYCIGSDNFRGVVSSHPSHSDADGFLECLLSSMDDIHGVLMKTSS